MKPYGNQLNLKKKVSYQSQKNSEKISIINIKLLHQIFDTINISLLVLIFTLFFLSFNSQRKWTNTYKNLSKTRAINNNLIDFISKIEEFYISELESINTYKKTKPEDLIYLNKLPEKIKIDNNDNLNTLSEKLSILSAKLFLNTTSLIEENINKNSNSQLTKQNTLGRKINYARMIKKSDFKVDWTKDAIKISQKIKALYTRANTTFRGKNLKILKIKVLISYEIKNEKYHFMSNYSKPGIILAVIENKGIIISTKTDPIILLEAKLEGKNISSKNQLIQQLKPSVGEYLSD